MYFYSLRFEPVMQFVHIFCAAERNFLYFYVFTHNLVVFRNLKMHSGALSSMTGNTECGVREQGSIQDFVRGEGGITFLGVEGVYFQIFHEQLVAIGLSKLLQKSWYLIKDNTEMLWMNYIGIAAVGHTRSVSLVYFLYICNFFIIIYYLKSRFT